MAGPSIRGAFDLPPEDALAAFRARDGFAFSVSWRDLEPENHARAFTVAKVAKAEILTTIKQSLDQAMAEGRSYGQWRADVEAPLREAGWWGMVRDPDLTGTSRGVFVGERRVNTIFTTNMRVSAASGQWKRIQALKELRPYLRYASMGDRNVRLAHRLLDGIILPVDHPFWLLFFPPNDWGCRCSVRQLAEVDLERRGWRVTTDEELAAILAQLPGAAPTAFGPPGERQEREATPGIGTGWNYNPGAESLAGIVAKAAQTITAARAAGLADVADQLLRDALALLGDDLGRMLLELLGDAGSVAASAAETAIAASSRRRGKRAKGGKGGLTAEGRESLRRHAKERQGADGRFKPGTTAKPAIKDPQPDRGRAATREQVEQFEAATRRDPSSNRERLTLGFIDRGDLPGVAVGERLAFKQDRFRHLLNRHGVGSRDRNPVTADDFMRIPRIVGAGSARQGAPTRDGNATVQIDHELDGVRYRVILERQNNPRMQGQVVFTFFKR